MVGDGRLAPQHSWEVGPQNKWEMGSCDPCHTPLTSAQVQRLLTKY